ncbi:Short C-terminal domain-containing protein [Chryseobacterium ureilyticum]|uniref:Short C-terminal domain-containing protein n=1 Tax=Chryseobacterium ureilyticum TaxID=373668 RepID=A0A1N7MAU5_9FLAO|nr:SHOCT domain-containing protein [Chryseobacterium ureilyticum]SIS83245.1 Short C-terminal domain-containing protein [Chryseobacterium ureilyticum]
MKQVLLIFTLLIFGISYSQTAPIFENDTLVTSTGFKVYEGLDLKIGTGSMNDGDFKFIRTNASSLFNYSSTTGYQGLANQANSFKRSNSGLTFKVKKIMPRGNKKNGFVYYAKIGSGLMNYEVDLENAIRSGEVIVPDEFLPKEKSQHINSETKYDRLKKIKELKDSGVLSEEEFQKEKDKIMAEK